jgi:hypothetical protein
VKLSSSKRCLLFTANIIACVTLGCGQKQGLRPDPPFPEIVRVVTLPMGFEVWFKHDDTHRIALWTQQKNTYGKPALFATGGPIKLTSAAHSLKIRFAIETASGIGPVSPPFVLSRVQRTALPAVTCDRVGHGQRLNISWNHYRDDGSQRLMVMDNGQLLAVLSRKGSQLVLDKRSSVLELVYEDRTFRSSSWSISCPRPITEHE